MPTLKTYDLFISHAWKYGDDYDRLTKLLDSAPYFYYRNYSAPSHKPLQNLNATDAQTKSQIKSAIDRKIQHVNAVIIISGMYYTNRYWMQYELDCAIKYKKPIIALKPYGNSVVPADILSKANAVVNWSTDSIVTVIRQVSI